MKEFEYTITDPLGIHARPAGQLVKVASTSPCEITITKGGKTVSAKKLFAVMGLGVKCGDHITVHCEGEGESETLTALQSFFRENL